MMNGLDLHSIAEAIRLHGSIVRVGIAAFQGSAPRETGTSMLVWSEGQSGTIGGGALEWDAVQRARSLSCSLKMLRYPLGPALGQCCGGAVTLVFERWDAMRLRQAKAVLSDAYTQSTETPFFLARSLADNQLVAEAPKLPTTAHKMIQSLYEGQMPMSQICGEWLIEPLATPARALFIYGAGHVGRAIAQCLSGLAFDIKLIDDAENRFPDPVPQHVTPVLAANPADAVALAPDTAMHLVLTYSHALDLEICHRVLARDFGHLGLIGSATKATRFRKRLQNLGHSQDKIERLTCPIGERALGKEPQAIAVGVTAELIRLSQRQAQADGGLHFTLMRASG